MTAVSTPDGALAAVFRGGSEREDVEWPLIKLARLSGWLVFHGYSMRRSQPGFPDLVMARLPSQRAECYGPPYILFVECKAESASRGRLTLAQKTWGKALGCIELASGGAIVYRVVRPSTRADVEAILVGAQPGAGKPRVERDVLGGEGR